jgi:hypothetical protein
MANRSSLLRRVGLGDWVFTIAYAGFMGWAVLFVADEPYERVIGIGSVLFLCTVHTVRWLRGRRSEQLATSDAAATVPTWRRHIAPSVLAVVGVANLFAFLLVGRWLVGALVACCLLAGWVALVAGPRREQSDRHDVGTDWKPPDDEGVERWVATSGREESAHS